MSRLPFFYGWVMLPVVTLIGICTSPGQTYGIAVFNSYLREALSLSSSELSGAYALGTILASLPLTYIGALMDRYGPRRVLFGVVFLFGITCVGVTQVSGLVTLFLAFFFLRLLGQGAMSMMARNALAMWFNKRLGMASGIASLGLAAAVGGVPALSIALIEAYSWRGAYAILGGIVWLIVFPLLIFVFRNRPEDMGQAPDGSWIGDDEMPVQVEDSGYMLSEVVRMRSYWIAVLCMASWSMSGTGVQFHIVSIFAERGLDTAAVAKMFSVYAMVMAGGRFLAGVLADRLRLNILLSVALVAQCLGLVALNELDSVWLLLVFPISSALGSSLLVSVGETIWVRYYGRRHLGKIRGSASTIGVASSGVGPFIMGAAFDFFGGFQQVLRACAVLAVVLALLAPAATPPRCRA